MKASVEVDAVVGKEAINDEGNKVVRTRRRRMTVFFEEFEEMRIIDRSHPIPISRALPRARFWRVGMVGVGSEEVGDNLTCHRIFFLYG